MNQSTATTSANSIATRRRKKFERDPNAFPRFNLQERDVEIIKTVADFRFADARQLTALHPGSDDRIALRLQKLFHTGYLDRPRQQAVVFKPRPYFIYALGDKGARLLADKFSDNGNPILDGREAWLLTEASWRKKNWEAGASYLWHTLMIGDFRTALTLALKDHPTAKLASWRQGEDLKDFVRLEDGKAPVIPDAYFTIKSEKGIGNFFFEADRSTMTLDRFCRKVEAYRQWRREGLHEKKYGIKHFRVVTVTISEERRDNIVEALAHKVFKDAEKKGALAYLFACEKEYNQESPKKILEQIWISPKGERHRLLE